VNKAAKWAVAVLALALGVFLSRAVVWHKGEKLLQPLPIPGEGWTAKRTTNDQAKMEMEVWTKNSGSGSETLQVIVAHDRGHTDVKRLQEKEDKAGKGYCSNFSSNVMDTASENNYKTITWKTKCRLRGKNAEVVVLHKAIAGEDSLYIIQKTWNDSFNEESLRVWIDYLNRIGLCSARGAKHPCPEGFKK
jgi:hypothetical protein